MADKKEELDIFIASSIYPDAASISRSEHKPLEAIKQDCYVVVDTNALLLPYTVSKASFDEIRKTYQLLINEKRFVVPAQVAREFAKNRAARLGDLYQQLAKKRDSIQLPKRGEAYPFLESINEYQELATVEDELHKLANKYRKVIGNLMDSIRGWSWDDPVSRLYGDLFKEDLVFELELDDAKKSALKQELNRRSIHKIPPGYKDSAKPDEGVGDFLIWQTILEIGKKYQKGVIFVSGEEKPDW